MVLKASEHASAPMLEFAKVFEEAGFPPGVMNIVTGYGEPLRQGFDIPSSCCYVSALPAGRKLREMLSGTLRIIWLRFLWSWAENHR